VGVAAPRRSVLFLIARLNYHGRCAVSSGARCAARSAYDAELRSELFWLGLSLAPRFAVLV